MNASAASLAASLSELQSSWVDAPERPVHGPLTLQAEIATANAKAHALLEVTTLTPACRAVIERLTSLTDAMASHGGCLDSAHQR